MTRDSRTADEGNECSQRMVVLRRLATAVIGRLAAVVATDVAQELITWIINRH
ncbi:hypothetical protein P9869_43225 [Streptomyces ossamyceticus]|nr:hypothetical protein [Streptomyces ossamyceticus]